MSRGWIDCYPTLASQGWGNPATVDQISGGFGHIPLGSGFNCGSIDPGPQMRGTGGTRHLPADELAVIRPDG